MSGLGPPTPVAPIWRLTAVHHGRQPVYRLALHVRKDSRIDIESRRDRGMAEPFLHDLRRLPGRQQRSGMTVAKLLDRDTREVGRGHYLPEPPRDVLGIRWPANLVARDPLPRRPGLARAE